MLAGVFEIAGFTAAVAVVLGVVLHAPEGYRRLAVRWHRTHDGPRPLGPPVEQLARDVERIRRDLATLDPDSPRARRVGILAAYDDVLVDACRALGLPHTLPEEPDGLEREVERLRIEDALVTLGLIRGRTPGR